MRPNPEAPFREPWEAHAFALAVELSDKGVFEWREFSLALGAQIKAAAEQGREEPYYALWLTALEKLLANKGVVSEVVVDARTASMKAQAAQAHATKAV
ncbi:MAG: nitrile hydratase accessory protein [Hyphomicrobiales bacterium]|nr:nitrile hydratase accessory protein [Hyphomicrobiales bacterium]